ncbi:MAG: pirin family protein [Chromatiales bacterium]|nr:pirin family protein [Chromatiales bacterium]
MITILRSEDRGSADFGWLQSRHSFSFGHYYNPQQMGFGNLRVINEDTVLPGKGFGTHGHKDMEIISYVISGALEHRDSMGNGSIIQAGDVQRMSAGSGVQHSEFNPSSSEPVHFLQIWILPERTGADSGYQQLHFSGQEKTNRLCLVASRDGRDGSLGIQQEADIFACLLEQGKSVSYALTPGRRGWIQIVRGSVQINGMSLSSGDAAAVEGEESLEIAAGENAEFLLFDLG